MPYTLHNRTALYKREMRDLYLSWDLVDFPIGTKIKTADGTWGDGSRFYFVRDTAYVSDDNELVLPVADSMDTDAEQWELLIRDHYVHQENGINQLHLTARGARHEGLDADIKRILKAIRDEHGAERSNADYVATALQQADLVPWVPIA